MTTYTTTFAVKRRCKKCNISKPTAGGRTYPGGRTWVCKDCRTKTTNVAHKQQDMPHKRGGA